MSEEGQPDIEGSAPVPVDMVAVEPAPKEQRTPGMLCHLLALTGYVGVPFGNIIGPLVIWLIKKDEMPFVDDQGKESLNFQISATLALMVLGVTMLIPLVGCVTAFVAIAVAIGVLIYTIIGTVKAAAGEWYRYPVSFRFFT